MSFDWQGHKGSSVDDLPIAEVVDRIEKLNSGLRQFWAKSAGWAPVDAAGLLGKARLDWQQSLSGTLRLWATETPAELSDGQLILAWANLGSLVEGTLKLFLSAYYKDFQTDIIALKKAGSHPGDPTKAKAPDGLQLEPLRQFVKEKDLFGIEADNLIELVQQRRNAIHSFKDRPIGTAEEFQTAARGYLKLLRLVNERLPYPDDRVPREI